MSRAYALIPAAGAGVRMGGVSPKQYLDIAGRPLLWHTLRALCGHPRIEHVFLVLAAGDALFARHDWRNFTPRLTPLYCGGSTRAASVFNGLLAVRDEVGASDWVLVHDAVRPCLGGAELDRLLAALAEDDTGGLLAVPVSDTLKRAGGDARVVRTEARDALWLAQTPQMFRYQLLLEALRKAEPAVVTDEAGAIEALGLKPKVVMGSPRNIKVTYPEDLLLAQSILRSQPMVDTMRIGQGFDTHALVTGRKLIIGGVDIPYEKGLAGHSDADVLIHAVCDALLGAAGLGDIGAHFPDSDSRYKDIDSRKLLNEVRQLVRSSGFHVANVDATIIAQAPRMAPHIPAMRANLAADLGIAVDAVNVKAKTTEKLGFVGRGEGIAAEAVALLLKI